MIDNYNRYIPNWHKDGTLDFIEKKPKSTNGQKVKAKKRIFNQIDLKKIRLSGNYEINPEIQAIAEDYKQQTSHYLPVALNHNNVLVFGYESFLPQKIKHKEKVSFQLVDTPSHSEPAYRYSAVQTEVFTHLLKTTGSPIYVAEKHYKAIAEMRKIADRKGLRIEITERFLFKVYHNDTNVLLFGGKYGDNKHYVRHFITHYKTDSD